MDFEDVVEEFIPMRIIRSLSPVNKVFEVSLGEGVDLGFVLFILDGRVEEE